MAQLRIEGVSKSFGDEPVLDNVNITVGNHEIVSLIGASGGGKTTLFHIISGLEQPDCGKIYLDEVDITGQPGQVSYMLQKDLLLPHLTLEDNIALPLLLGKNAAHKSLLDEGAQANLSNSSRMLPWLARKHRKQARSKIAPMIVEFGLAGMEKKYPHQLSGGMRQRAALLRTYLFSDRFALLDEPFSALDTITRAAMHEWYLGVMNQIKLSTIFITHDIDEAILLSDRIYVLAGKPGTIVTELQIVGPRPRHRDFLLSDMALGYKKQLMGML